MIERVEVAGVRHYVTPDGTLPSVTAILSGTKPEESAGVLARWRERVGEGAAKATMVAAAARGTRLHAKAEAWLRASAWELPETSWSARVTDPWWASLVPFMRSVRGCSAVEEFVWHAEVGYAGALDAIVTLRSGKTYVTDWKTTGRPKVYADALHDYRAQGAAYYHAAATQGLRADGVVIVVAHDCGPAETIFVTGRELDSAWSEFRRRAEAFAALRDVRA